MKQILLLAAFLASASSALTQGLLQAGNTFSGLFRAPIYGPDPADPFLMTSGQSALGFPAGTTVYNGPLLQGTGYTFALFAGPSGTTDPAALELVTTTTFRTGTSLPAGTVFTLTLPIPGVGVAQIAALQVRVWDNQGGAVGNWAAVLANPSVARGQSAIFASAPLGFSDPVSGAPVSAPPMTGWTSFNIYQVPEPSLLALGALGLAALCFRRRS